MMGIQTIKDENFVIKNPSGEPDQIKYIDKLELATVNERGMDDLTGASYVSDASWECQAATYMTGGIAYGVTTVVAGGTTKNPSITLGAAEASGVFTAAAVRASCDDDYLLGTGPGAGGNPFNFSSPDGGNGGNQGDPMEQGSFGIEEPDNGDENNNGNEDGNTGSDTDTTSDDNDSDDDANDSSEGDSWWDTVVEFFTGEEDTDTEAGGDDSNPNPYADGSQGSTSKPTIGPAPGDIGGRYDTVFNPGAERGFTPGNDDDGDGNPGNPWDRNERMSTPNGDGDPIDPLTGFGGPSDPEGNDGGPEDPDGEFNSSGPGDDLWKPNPDDTWGGGPNSQSFEGNEIEKIFELAGTQSFDSTSDFQAKDLMIASMSVDTFGL